MSLNYWGDDKICIHAEQGVHIRLTCKHHPHMRWMTKNLGYIGARTIFYLGNPEHANLTAGRAHTMDDCDVKLAIQNMIGREAMEEQRGYSEECPCPASDLIIVHSDDSICGREKA